MYRALSHHLYKVIDKHYLLDTQIKNRIYDRVLLESYGRCMRSYVGQGECHRASLLVKDHLAFPNMKLYLSTKDILFVEKTRLPIYNHVFLKSDDLIIDPTYKQLFFFPSGSIHKWESPYAKHLQSLDPIFIGTNEELSSLITELKERKDDDIYHRDDIWIVDWYRTASKV